MTHGTESAATTANAQGVRAAAELPVPPMIDCYRMNLTLRGWTMGSQRAAQHRRWRPHVLAFVPACRGRPATW